MNKSNSSHPPPSIFTKDQGHSIKRRPPYSCPPYPSPPYPSPPYPSPPYPSPPYPSPPYPSPPYPSPPYPSPPYPCPPYPLLPTPLLLYPYNTRTVFYSNIRSAWFRMVPWFMLCTVYLHHPSVLQPLP